MAREAFRRRASAALVVSECRPRGPDIPAADETVSRESQHRLRALTEIELWNTPEPSWEHEHRIQQGGIIRSPRAAGISKG